MSMQPQSCHQATRSSQRGMNLIELMIAMTIGVFLLLGLTTVFTNSSKTQRELEYTGQLVENGRYGVEFVYQDVRHAGAFGWLVSLGDPASVVDSCSTTASNLQSAVQLPMYGYDTNATGTRAALSGHCGTLLSNANLAAGSDVLVVRRANTNVFTGTPVVGQPYIQANVSSFDVQIGATGASVPTNTADNNTPTIMQKDNVTPAEVRAYETHIYFVAPCTVGQGTDGACDGSAGEDTVPALKRLYITGSGGTTKFLIEPLVEGVEYFQVEYGIDNSPTAEDDTTGEQGDGVPDVYRTIPASTGEWAQVAAVRLYMLVRSTNASTGYTDEKAYTLGNASTFAVGAANDAFKRHVFSAEAAISNISGRREIPL